MKMGTIVSPWRYDAAAAETIRPDNQRRTTILRYASWAAVFPISLVVRLPFDSGPFDQSRDRRHGPISDINDEPTIELTYDVCPILAAWTIASVTRFRSVMRSVGGAADQHRQTIFASGSKFL